MNGKIDDKSLTSTIRLTRERLLELPFTESRRAALPRTDLAGKLPFMSSAGSPPDIRPRLLKNLFSTAFPYPRYLRAQAELREQDYDVVHLENGRFSLKLVPGLGGRVLGLYDHVLDTELLWQPPALRNAAVGLAGAWFVGGLEFNAFRYGHLAYGLSCLLTEEVELAGGWKGVRISAVDEMFNASWSATLVVLPDQVALRLRMENHSDAPVPGYWWTNIAVPANNRTKLFYHGGLALHHGVMRNEFISETWPHLHGRDWSEWTEHHECISAYLVDHGSDYFGHCDRGTGFGLAHRADRQVCRGRKLWSVGAQYSNAVWMSRMGEPNIGSYVELQCGRLPTQIEADLLAPGQVVEWTESLTGLAWTGDPAWENDAAFASFENAAAKAMQGSAKAVEDPANWRVVSERTLVAEDERLAASRTAVFFPGEIDKQLADKVCSRGWVAGPGWRKALARLAKAQPLAPACELALAAAELDSGGIEIARRSLVGLAQSKDAEVRGWASLLLAQIFQRLKDDAGALPHLRNVAAELGADLDATVLIHDMFVAAGRAEEAQKLWGPATGELRDSDAGRFARSQLAFISGEYAATRSLLSAAMPSVGENAFAAWTLWKEAHAAEAFAHWKEGNRESASRLLALAAEAAPQFSLGRDEVVECRDLLYYRWWLARARGQELTADTFAGWLRPARAFPSTIDAAYLARFAADAAHPSATDRRRDIERWEAEAHDIDLWTFHPLHQAVMSVLREQAREGWERLKRNWLYKPRAEFELQWVRDAQGFSDKGPRTQATLECSGCGGSRQPAPEEASL
jgi:hypothetical protein